MNDKSIFHEEAPINQFDTIYKIFPEAEIWKYLCRIGNEPADIPHIDGVTTRPVIGKETEQIRNLKQDWLWKYYDNPQEFCEKYDSIGVFKDDELLSISAVFSCSEKYSNIAAATHPDYRGRGYAGLASASLANILLKNGKSIIWMTSEDNIPSQKIPQRLNFKPFIWRNTLFKINWKPS
ncbi:GNAT family N-acetyltransferase [bacterium]|nr:GNAT family N-acetyltransferase [FCB group bacterium]MBL7191044.1 GNAT family N-acetyltransferase [bacterium]